MNFKEQKIKEFGNLFDNHFLQWNLTDKLGTKARAEAFLHKVLEEQEKDHKIQLHEQYMRFDKITDIMEKHLKLSQEEIFNLITREVGKDLIFSKRHFLAKAICALQGEPNERY